MDELMVPFNEEELERHLSETAIASVSRLPKQGAGIAMLDILRGSKLLELRSAIDALFLFRQLGYPSLNSSVGGKGNSLSQSHVADRAGKGESPTSVRGVQRRRDAHTISMSVHPMRTQRFEECVHCPVRYTPYRAAGQKTTMSRRSVPDRSYHGSPVVSES